MARVVFMGTPDAALPSLQELAREHQIVKVVTQPDRPQGRSRRLIPSPVKEIANELNLPIAQPTNRGELIEALEAVRPFDVGVVVAYGRILTPAALAIPEMGMINVHFSLLPRWRGAAPVERALLAGDSMTGVTIIELDPGLDTGPVLTAQAIDIADSETGGELTTRLAALGANLVAATLPRYLSGDLEPVTQSDDGATYAEKITTADRSIQPTHDVATTLARVRALAPSPGAALRLMGESHKILGARASSARPEPGEWRVIDAVPVIGVSNGGVEVVSLQPPGKKQMEGRAWVRGLRIGSGHWD